MIRSLDEQAYALDESITLICSTTRNRVAAIGDGAVCLPYASLGRDVERLIFRVASHFHPYGCGACGSSLTSLFSGARRDMEG